MATLVRRNHTPVVADLFDWIEEGLPALGAWPAFGPMRSGMRLEERREEGRYLLRAELPGINPEKDVTLTVADGALTIRAERQEEKQEGGRSEFHYGAFARRVPLPTGAKEETISATYTDGILEIAVELGPEQPTEKTIPITTAKKK